MRGSPPVGLVDHSITGGRNEAPVKDGFLSSLTYINAAAIEVFRNALVKLLYFKMRWLDLVYVYALI
jgi:hypothetical protein